MGQPCISVGHEGDQFNENFIAYVEKAAAYIPGVIFNVGTV